MLLYRRQNIAKFIILSCFILVITKYVLQDYVNFNQEETIVNNTYGITLVTSYFNISSKHPHEEYLLWMDNLLMIEDNMVIYTESWMIPIMKNYSNRRNNNTQFISLDIKDSQIAQKYSMETWENQRKLDEEAHVHGSIQTYWVWNEKVNMVKDASDRNVFNSEYFLWVDIGYLRSSGGQYKNKTWVRRPKFHSSCVLLLVVDDFTAEDLEVDRNGISNVSFANPKSRIAAGAWGGTASAINSWHKHYYDTVDQYYKQGRFFGMEQAVMATTCVQHMDVCCFVSPRKEWLTNWFWFGPFLAGQVQSPIYRFTRP